MAMTSLQDAFIDELRDILSAEKQLTKALPKMAKHASSDKLRMALQNHLEETQNQISRLEQVFELFELTPRAKKCEAMAGLLEEGQSLLEEDADPDVKDALIIAAAQKVEHYEIATYGTLRTWAELMSCSEAADLLQETLDEEGNADSLLTELSKTINVEALEEVGAGAEEEEEEE